MLSDTSAAVTMGRTFSDGRLRFMSSHPVATSSPLVIMIPVFNDWESLRMLLGQIDAVVGKQSIDAQVLILNDGSTDPVHVDGTFQHLRSVRLLELRRNLGHQRAICIGLTYVHEHIPCRGILVMDADGEDDPIDIPKLLAKMEQEQDAKVVFARRDRRSESLPFRVFYNLYKFAHRILTGHRVEVGNYSVIPASQLRRLVVVSELWNHFAAAIYSSRTPYVMVPTARAKRLAGRSKMNFVALVTHGLSAISVFSDRVGVRVLVALAILTVMTALAIVTTVTVRLTTGWAIPGWATSTTALLVVILLQMIMIASIYIVLVLAGRQGLGFLPLRDYKYFCGELRTIFPADRPVD